MRASITKARKSADEKKHRTQPLSFRGSGINVCRGGVAGEYPARGGRGVCSQGASPADIAARGETSPLTRKRSKAFPLRHPLQASNEEAIATIGVRHETELSGTVGGVANLGQSIERKIAMAIQKCFHLILAFGMR